MTHFTEKNVPLIINVPLISHIINLLTNLKKSLLRKIISPLFLKKSKKCFSNWFRHSKCVYNLQGKSKLIISTSLQASSSGLNFNVNIKKKISSQKFVKSNHVSVDDEGLAALTIVLRAKSPKDLFAHMKMWMVWSSIRMTRSTHVRSFYYYEII